LKGKGGGVDAEVQRRKWKEVEAHKDGERAQRHETYVTIRKERSRWHVVSSMSH